MARTIGDWLLGVDDDERGGSGGRTIGDWLVDVVRDADASLGGADDKASEKAKDRKNVFWNSRTKWGRAPEGTWFR